MSTRELTSHVRSVSDASVVLVLHESATEPLDTARTREARSLTLIIGPEGGIADDELAALIGAGATAVRLGPSVLRTTTAAAVALGALGVVTPRWRI
jgi:16S rRNA (uracil1498-N3)-methyltransferase